jgi:hypothetical protein
MEAAKVVINLALSFGGWVYGGYVRDVMICKMDHFNDLDIAICEGYDLDTFIKCLGSLGGELVIKEDYDFDNPYQMKCGRRLVKVVIGGILNVDIYVVKSFEDWCNDHSCDMTCNIFYKSSTCFLGLRYIPEQFKYNPDPAGYLLAMTEARRFVSIQGETEKFAERKKKRIDEGWLEL